MFEAESFESYNHTSYTEFKKYIDGTYATLAFQYQEKTDYYIIVTEPYAGITQSFDLIKDAGANQIDFETNFKTLPPRKPGSYQTTEITGSITAGNLFSGKPIVISGIDGSSNVRVIKTTTDGTVRIDPIGTTTQPISGTVSVDTGSSGNFTVVQSDPTQLRAQLISEAKDNDAIPDYTINIGAHDGGRIYRLDSLTSAPSGPERGLIVRNIPSGTQDVSISSSTTIPVSGTVTATINAIGSNNTTSPTSSILIGASDGTNLRPLRSSTTTPGGTEQGLIVRNIPSGTQTVSGSGNFTVIQSTASNLNASIVGTSSDNSSNSSTKLAVIAARSNTLAPSWTDGNMVPLSVDTSGALRITGSISATNPSVNSVNTTPPTSLTYVGGNVSTSAPSYTNGNASAISLTTSGAIRVDNSAVTQPVSGTITANAGTGNFTVVQSTASSLRSQTASEGTSGSAIPTVSSLIGGNDGTNLRPIGALNTNPSGTEYGLVVRNLPSGTQTISGTVTANAGTGVFDVTPASPAANDYLPVRLTDGTSFYSASGATIPQTFTACATSVVIGNNKSMFSITNATGSGVVIKVYEIYITNVQTTAVTGVIGNFELRRIVSHSAGTLVTSEEMDTNNVLNANVTARTGSTVATESTTLLWRVLYSTDEWGAGTLDVEANDHANQALFPVWMTSANTQPITLRENQGLTVKFATNSTAGSFDILVKFTQE